MLRKNPKIDHNINLAVYSSDGYSNNDHGYDTTLSLECFGSSGSKANSREQKSKTAPNGCGLVLGLGPTPSNYSSEVDSFLKLSLSSSWKSDVKHQSESIEVNKIPGGDEGSTSAKRSGGYMPSLLFAPRITTAQKKRKIFEPEEPLAFTTASALEKQTRSKRCKFSGGGRRCRFYGCKKGCQAHGLVSCSLDNQSLSGVSMVSNTSTNWLDSPYKRQLLPPQVLVPSSMKSSSFSSYSKRSSDEVVIPEGRVHGGRLLSLLGGNLRDAVIDGI